MIVLACRVGSTNSIIYSWFLSIPVYACDEISLAITVLHMKYRCSTVNCVVHTEIMVLKKLIRKIISGNSVCAGYSVVGLFV